MSNSDEIKTEKKTAFEESGFGKSLEGGQEIKVWKFGDAGFNKAFFKELAKFETVTTKTPPGDHLTTNP